MTLTVEFDLADSAKTNDAMASLFATVSEGAEELYTTNLAQQIANRNAELLEQMADEERKQYHEAMSDAGIEDMVGEAHAGSWVDEYWYRCQVDGKDALVCVSAVKDKKVWQRRHGGIGGIRVAVAGARNRRSMATRVKPLA